MRNEALLFLLVITFTTFIDGFGQETVFTLLKSERSLADQYFAEKNYQGALNLYNHIAKKNLADKDILLKTGRCYYFLKQYDQCASSYERCIKIGQALSPEDRYYFAEAEASLAKYNNAIAHYQQYLVQSHDDLVMKKIWQLSNIQFLYEDSLHYAVRPLSLNTAFGELCAVPFRDGLVFISNRKEIEPIEKIDGSSNAPFYKIYFSKAYADSTGAVTFRDAMPASFSKDLGVKLHVGPIIFYDHFRKMVFSATGNEAGANGRTLQLFFAEEHPGGWKIAQSFPYNSVNYSISDPAISEDGRLLIFSSDMKGGIGGKDLYQCEYDNGKWSRPANLGELVNTSHDEVFPYLHNEQALYFSSNGHAGLGGLDVFKAEITPKGFDEPQNLGYPINTNADEFGIFIDSLSTHGYFSTNRQKGGYNDDIYEFDMDLQTYPLSIDGLLKFKEHNWSDSAELKTMPHAKIYLIDHLRNITVYETTSSESGNFVITIPYFSKYKIRVVEEDNDENIVSLEIPKQRKSYSIHEIVIIKDAFKINETQK